MRAAALRAWLLLLLMLAAAGARAHFASGYDLRVVHFERVNGGLNAYMRLTLPLVVAGGIGPKDESGFHTPPAFVVRRIESAHAFYYPDVLRIRAEPLALGRLIADGHRLEASGEVLTPRVLSVRSYPKGLVPPFNSLEEARAATAAGPSYPENAAEVDAAYVVVDAHLFYPYRSAIQGFTLSSTLDNRILGQPEVQNLLVDHEGDQPLIYKRTGLLHEPIDVNPSALQASRSFFSHGLEHVTQGLDHLLFILCLALGATGLGALIWRVTAFTVGHAISLALGFFGYVPTGPWFIPAVETAIAASILLAAISVLVRRASARALTMLTIAVGVVHGLGFSFALRELLDAQGPHVLASFGAFNLGVEAGQAGFAALVFGSSILAAGWSIQVHNRGRAAVALGCAAIALVWTLERGRVLLA